MKCGRVSCEKEAPDGRYYCSRDCARQDVDSQDGSPTPSSEEQETSSTPESGEPSPQSSIGGLSPETKSERDTERLPIEKDRPSITEPTRNASLQEIEPGDHYGLMKGGRPSRNDELNGEEKTGIDSGSAGRSGMTETELSRTERNASDDGSEIQVEDSQQQLMHLREGISQSRSLIRDCANHTLDLMKSIGNDANKDGTLRDFRKINSIAGLAREVANLAKVELEALKIAKDLRE